MTRICASAVLALAVVVPAIAGAQDKVLKPAAVTATAPLNLNTATAEQLEALPGIGVKIAERIVEYRQKNGGFKKVEELMNVRGVGEKSFLKSKAMLTVAAPKTERAAAQ
jgi:comEA protein